MLSPLCRLPFLNHFDGNESLFPVIFAATVYAVNVPAFPLTLVDGFLFLLPFLFMGMHLRTGSVINPPH